MTESTPPAETAAPAGPYGPASTTPPVVTGAEPVWVERGRRALRIAVWITAGLSVILTVALVALGLMGMATLNLDIEGPGSAFVWLTVIGAPVLFVIALNLLVWRAMLRPLSRRARGEAVVIGLAVGAGLAIVSVIIVVILLTVGFFVGMAPAL